MNIKFKSIEIEAFRGYKTKQIFDFTENDQIMDLVVLYAPNGFGKTSFFDAVEWGFSKIIKRISKNNKIKDIADIEKGYILKNKDSQLLNGILKFITDADDSIILHTLRLNNRRQRDDGPPKVETGKKLYERINGENFIEKNVLTHDKIDSFLRFTSSKERFNALKEFWNGDGEADTYKDLLFLIIEAGKKHDKIIDEKEKIEIELKQLTPSFQIVDHIIKLIQQFNEIDPNETKINEITKDSIDYESILQEWYNLKTIFEIRERTREQIIDELNSLKDNFKPNYLENGQMIEKYVKEQNELLATLNKFMFLTNSNNEMIEIEKIIVINLEKKKDYEFLKEGYIGFVELLNEISSLQGKELGLNLSLKECSSKILDFESQLSKKINEQEEMKINLDKNKVTIVEIGETIGTLKLVGKEKFYGKRILRIKNVIEELINQRQKMQGQIQIFSRYSLMDTGSLIELSLNDHNSNISALAYDLCSKLYTEISRLRDVIEEQRKKYLKYDELNNTAKEMLRIGVEIVTESKTSSCPLCNHTYTSFNELIMKMNSDLSELLQIEKITNEISATENQIQILENELTNARIEYDTSLNKEIVSLNILIKQCNDKLNNFEQHMERVNRSLAQDRQQVLKIKEFFILHQFNFLLSKEERISQLLSFKELMEISSSESIEKINQTGKTIEEITKQIYEKKNEMHLLQTSIEQNKIILDNVEKSQTHINYKHMMNKYQFNTIENFFSRIGEVLAETDQIIAQKSSELVQLKTAVIEVTNYLKELDQNELVVRKEVLEEAIDRLSGVHNQYKVFYNKFFLNEDISNDVITLELERRNKNQELIKKQVHLILEIINNMEAINNNKAWSNKKKQLDEVIIEKQNISSLLNELEAFKRTGKEYVQKKIQTEFNLEAINNVYQMIDPHPEMTNIDFEVIYTEDDQLGLSVYTYNKDKTHKEAPSLYFSSAQVNILSLSIFIAGALEGKSDINTIFMDDPIQHLDSINILSFIDLLRIITSDLGRQVIISTHDERFFNLVKKKLDPNYFNSKFIELDAYGRVKK